MFTQDVSLKGGLIVIHYSEQEFAIYFGGIIACRSESI